MNIKDLYREQEDLAKKAILTDSFEKLDLIGGADCSYMEDSTVISGIVVIRYDTLDPVSKVYNVLKVNFPYIPGLLAYREAGAMISAYEKLEVKPDILVVDGFGTNHPRRCGIATYIGVKLDIPTIGAGKSFLCGTVLDDYVYQSGERVGKIIRSGKSKKPIYVSPGHRISLSTSADIVMHCIKSGRLPEPTRLAHEYVTGLKSSLI